MNMWTVTNGPEPRNPRVLDAASNVVGDPYSVLTARLVVERFRRGELPEAVLLALMACAGLRP